MTENGAFKKRVRARAARTGENYTSARRRLLGNDERASRMSTTVEPHYLFTPPDVIEYIDERERRTLPQPDAGTFSWGYAGGGPLASAEAVLLDATGSTDAQLAMAFVSENLVWWDDQGEQTFLLTVAEVRAWRHEAESRVRRDGSGNRTSTAEELARDLMAHLSGRGPDLPWWQKYRDQHGEPQVRPEIALIDRALEVVRGSGPPALHKPIPVTPEQAMVLTVYEAVKAARDGYGREGDVARYSRSARSVGIPQYEIDAAIVAAGG